METEEAIFNEQVDRVTVFIEWLEQLEDKVGTTEHVTPHASDKGFDQSLRLHILAHD